MKTISEKFIQITAGKGPAECCWVVSKVLKILLREAEMYGIDCTQLHRENGSENGTLFSVTLQLEGDAVDDFVATWVGTIQWIGKSKFRKFHKRRNWFVGVNLLRFQSQEKAFSERNIRFEFTKSGGPGGQHVNKVNTAVRAKYLPTGDSVFVSQGRSQLQNKQETVRKLKEVLRLKSRQYFQENRKSNWQNHKELKRGNPIRVFTGSDFKANHQDKKYNSKRKKDKVMAFRREDN